MAQLTPYCQVIISGLKSADMYVFFLKRVSVELPPFHVTHVNNVLVWYDLTTKPEPNYKADVRNTSKSKFTTQTVV